jgi:hypothetical protein
MSLWWWPALMITYIVIFVWGMISNCLTYRKRMQLVDRWQYSGDFYLARDEFDLVSNNQHYWRVFFLKSPRSLYGPLIQGIWDYNPVTSPGTSSPFVKYNDYWWRCYKEIYLKLQYNWITSKKTRKYMAIRNHRYFLPVALAAAGLDPEELLPPKEKVTPEEKFSMQAGAEEYDQILAAQELIGS